MTSAILTPAVGEDAVLRMLGEPDLPLTLEWRNHAESRRWFHTTSPITPEQHRAWYLRYLERDDDYVFIMEFAGRPVAQVALYDIAEGAAEFGRLLVDPAVRGAGVSHRAIALCLQIADRTLGIDRLHLEVKPDNARAIVAYERAGFLPDPGGTAPHGAVVMRRQRP